MLECGSSVSAMFNNYHKSILPNGLRILSIPMDSVPSVTVIITVGAGTRYEDKRVNGIAHFLEHMAFKGTSKRPSALAISEIIDGIGGEFNAFTTKDHTGYYIKAHVKHLELLFDVLSDMLLHSLLDPAEIDKERGVIIEEINMSEDAPMRKVSDLYETLLYGDHPLGWEIAGRVQSIRAISRDDFVQYMDEFCAPQNSVLTIAGGLQKMSKYPNKQIDRYINEIVELSEKWLGSWKKHDVSHFLPWTAKQSQPGLLVHFKKTEQAHICLGTRSYPIGHPKQYALSILTTILGGGMSSRLFIEVREKRGLAYYVRSGAEQFHDTGHFVTQAGVDVKRATEAVEVILKEYFGIVNGTIPIKAAELRRAKEYIKGRLTLDLEDSRVVAGLYASQEILENKVRTPQEIMVLIDAVTIEDVTEVAREIFVRSDLNLAVIGPFEGKESFEKALSI